MTALRNSFRRKSKRSINQSNNQSINQADSTISVASVRSTRTLTPSRVSIVSRSSTDQHQHQQQHQQQPPQQQLLSERRLLRRPSQRTSSSDLNSDKSPNNRQSDKGRPGSEKSPKSRSSSEKSPNGSSQRDKSQSGVDRKPSFIDRNPSGQTDRPSLRTSAERSQGPEDQPYTYESPSIRYIDGQSSPSPAPEKETVNQQSGNQSSTGKSAILHLDRWIGRWMIGR